MCKYVYYPSEFLCVPHPVHVQTNKLSITLSEDVKRAIWHFPFWKTDRHPTVAFSHNFMFSLINLLSQANKP